MRADDSWHDPEDHYSPPAVDHFDQWEQEGWGKEGWAYWTGWDTLLRRLLMAGGVALVWAFFAMLVTIAIKGDL